MRNKRAHFRIRYGGEKKERSRIFRIPRKFVPFLRESTEECAKSEFKWESIPYRSSHNNVTFYRWMLLFSSPPQPPTSSIDSAASPRQNREKNGKNTTGEFVDVIHKQLPRRRLFRPRGGKMEWIPKDDGEATGDKSKNPSHEKKVTFSPRSKMRNSNILLEGFFNVWETNLG